MKKQGVLILLLLGALLAACAAPEAQARPEPSAAPGYPPAPVVEPRVQTATSAPPTSTPTLPPTASPTAVPPTLTPAPAEPELPLIGQVIAGRQALQAGPSKLFEPLDLLYYGDRVEVIAAAPGWEWVLARSSGGVEGWIKEQYLSLDLAVESLPLAPVDAGWITVSGAARDAGGKPVFGAYLVLYNGSSRATEAHSWEDGSFFFFVPREQQGDWQIAVVGMECRNWATNPICRQPGKFGDSPRTVRVVEDVTVEFVYR